MSTAIRTVGLVEHLPNPGHAVRVSMDHGSDALAVPEGATAPGRKPRPSKGVRVHPSAIIEDDVVLGDGTSVWDNVHIRHGATIGEECIVGEKTYVAYDVRIGDRVKINAFVYICAEVTIEDGVMVSAGTVFTNDRFPRATTVDLRQLRPSDPDDETLATRVCAGVTIGAGCVIGCGLEIGRFAMVGMGSVVTRPVAPFHLVVGQPAKPIGCVCRCGKKLLSFPEQVDYGDVVCRACGLPYAVQGGLVIELNPPV